MDGDHNRDSPPPSDPGQSPSSEDHPSPHTTVQTPQASEPAGGQSPEVRGGIAGISDDQLDTWVTALVLASVGGLILDVQSHIGGLDFAEEGFLTPEHSIIYGGVIGAMLLVGGIILARKRRGLDWQTAIPDGYGLGLVGLGLFVVGGPSDFVWHSAFGAEADVEALVSPTHLLLATGSGLFITSPLRAAWHRDNVTGWHAQFPVVIPATLLLTIMTTFTLYIHPAFVVPGTNSTGAAYGLAGLQFHAALLMGYILLLTARFRLAIGSYTLIIAGNGAAMTVLGDSHFLLPTYLVAGVLADILAIALTPTPQDTRQFRVFATTIPATLTALYFATLAATTGIAWTIHLWAGAIFLTAVIGLLISYLLQPTTSPVDHNPFTDDS